MFSFLRELLPICSAESTAQGEGHEKYRTQNLLTRCSHFWGRKTTHKITIGNNKGSLDHASKVSVQPQVFRRKESLSSTYTDSLKHWSSEKNPRMSLQGRAKGKPRVIQGPQTPPDQGSWGGMKRMDSGHQLKSNWEEKKGNTVGGEVKRSPFLNQQIQVQIVIQLLIYTEQVKWPVFLCSVANIYLILYSKCSKHFTILKVFLTTTNNWGLFCYHPHFTNGETEASGGYILWRWQRHDSNSSSQSRSNIWALKLYTASSIKHILFKVVV